MKLLVITDAEWKQMQKGASPNSIYFRPPDKVAPLVDQLIKSTHTGDNVDCPLGDLYEALAQDMQLHGLRSNRDVLDPNNTHYDQFTTLMRHAACELILRLYNCDLSKPSTRTWDDLVLDALDTTKPTTMDELYEKLQISEDVNVIPTLWKLQKAEKAFAKAGQGWFKTA